MAKWQKGQSGNPHGKKRGTSNRVTKAVKDALIEALNDGPGAVAFFNKLKNGSAEDQRCFANICARMLPHELVGSGGAPLIPDNEISYLELARRVAFVLEMGQRELDEPEDQGSRLSQKS